MNTVAKWSIALGAGIPGVLILIGLIGLLIQFFMKRCRKKAWNEISSLPKNLEPSDNSNHRRLPRLSASDREPLCPTDSSTTNIPATPDGHITIPITTDELTSSQDACATKMKPEQTLVQIQRERLNRLKEEENRTRPMLRLSTGELEIQRAIDEAQKEFDESTIKASGKLKAPR